MEVEEELEHFHYLAVLNHFSEYATRHQLILRKYHNDLNGLPEEDTKLISKYYPKLESISKLIDENRLVLDQITASHQNALTDLNQIAKDSNCWKKVMASLSSQRAQENIRSLLRQFVRDWSLEGGPERLACYGPVLSVLEKEGKGKKETLKVLVPGAGLGRLVYEISHLGFDCQGNEFSLFMLLPSEWILNSDLSAESIAIYPWLFPFSNHTSINGQCRPVMIPDIVPAAPKTGCMSMTAGDFLQAYTEASEWNYIVTCFFLDTAKNIVEYIRRIHLLLKPGGVWINHGPLLYHFEGSSDISIELSLEEVKDVMGAVGFKILSELTTSCPYTQDPQSMHQTIYRCSLMVMQK